MAKKIIIIGGGVAGLSAGIYARKNGFETEIFEMHNFAGGQCTAWDRKGYRFDYCLHWLVGSKEGVFNKIWQETGVINSNTVVYNHKIYSRFVDTDNNEFLIYSNINDWENYLINYAPEDEKAIRKMCDEMKKVIGFEPFEKSPETRSNMSYVNFMIKHFSIFRLMIKYGKKSYKSYLDSLGFTNKNLKQFMGGLFADRDFSALAFVLMLSWFHTGNAGYLMGGSLPFAQRMYNKYLSLNGKFNSNRKVVRILTENNVAKGIMLEDGSVVFADYVISAADGYSTIFKMLEGKYVSTEIKNAYDNWELFPPLVQVSFGINTKIPNNGTTSYLTKNLMIGSTPLKSGYTLMDYSFDPSMAPEGKTTMVMRFESNWEIWENMNEMTYKAEKEQITKDAITILEKHYPDISRHIEVIDVATPKTTVKFTGVWQGAYEGFLPTSTNMMKNLKMQLPGLKSFYMIGQWLFPGGGLPPSAQSGKWVIQNICKQEKTTFTS